MATDVAALNLEVNSDPVEQANVRLREMPKTASAAERAAAKFSATTRDAANSNEEFSKRTLGAIKSLEFERQQLLRSSAEREKYAALRRAGVTAMSAEGRAIAASVAALQAQREAAAGSNVEAKAGVGLFGQITDKIKGYGAALTVAAIATAAIAKGTEILDYANTVDKLAKSLKVSTIEAQALEAASRQTGKSAEDLNAQLSAGQKKLLTDTFRSAFGDTTRILEDVSSASKRLTDAWNDMSEASHQSMVAMFGDITASVLNALTDALIGWSAAIKEAGAVLSRVAKSPQIPSVGSFIESGQNVSAGIGGGFPTMDAGPIASTMDIVAEKAKDTRAEIDGLKQRLQETREEFDRDGDRAGILAADIAKFEARILSLTGALIGLNNVATGTAAALSPFAGKGIDLGADAFKGKGADILKPYLPGPAQLTRWMTEGLKPPATGGSSSSGKSDNDNIDAQIKRYEALADVAKRAGETIGANRAKNIEDLQREVRVQEQVEEVAAKLGAKYAEADAARKQQLRDEIALYEQRKAANQLALDSAKKAEDIEVRLGDGTRARAQLERELTLAKDSGRVSTEALMRAETERGEALEHQSLQARRFDDNLGSVAAGFKDASNSYARANDMFSQGGQLFNGVTSAMGDGLDVLLGKSTKTFGEIAEGFSQMLIKMTLQAAASNLLKAGGGLFDLLGGFLGFGGGVTAGPAPAGGYGGYAGYASTLPGFAGANANGNAFDRAGIVPFARGGIVDRPTLFPFAKGTGLMGEAGPEAIVPLRRGRGGRLGVDASGTGGSGTVIIINNNAPGTQATARESKGPSGQNQIDIIVEAVEGKMAGRLSRGQGSLGKTMEGKYGLQSVGR